MIVQCNNCQTKFKFDDTLIEGEGVWVRCSQCKGVFFLENPVNQEIVSPLEKENKKEGTPTEIGKEKENYMEDRKVNIKQPELDLMREKEKEAGDIDKMKIAGFDKSKAGETRNDDKVPEGEVKKKHAPARGKQLLYLFIILLLGGLYLTFFSETGKQMLFEQLFGTTTKSEEVGPAQVELTDIRQRLVNNLSLGTIRVVEGTAINQSLFRMTRIKVKGEITDAYTVVLRVREAYCGNLLTDDELATMTEDQIQKELSNPQGSDVSNDRVESKDAIPFMIVFTREPPGVVKAFVTPSGAERLLP